MTDMVLVPRELVRFLLGEGPLDGLEFGEARVSTGGRVARFWWRDNLRRAMLSAAPPAVGGEEIARIRRDMIYLQSIDTDHRIVGYEQATDSILSALGRTEATTPPAWQPIEAAPRDGTEFQAWWRGQWQPRARFDPEYGSFQLWGRTDYDTEGWECFAIEGFWQPLPTPPEGEG